MTAILFSETGLEPIRYRRAKQLVNYLRYLVEPDGWNRLVADALADSLDLARTHHISWVNDICIVLSKLPYRSSGTSDCPMLSQYTLRTKSVKHAIYLQTV
ncbi:hypothetical protein B0H10DRAFT_2031678 [Mycena sp. CBHHK59/15]|nr:hypothetical protein B0H10DRAFT_2031678 [Mycena sp. CBHHK59/15]